jgi:2,3,4,5-tetrahydropyridine-2-carboxylate N-succinyltransferase
MLTLYSNVINKSFVGLMKNIKLQQIIEDFWENINTSQITEETVNAVNTTLNLLDNGEIRIAEKQENSWKVNTWMKKAILISFKMNSNNLINSSITFPEMLNYNWFDKVKLKFSGWSQADFVSAGIRAVPGSIVRHSAFIEKNVVLMPSFVNVGTFIGEGSMIDTWATVGSCAQIGKHCHISGGTGIGGVLEPLQNNPVIIEDNCFIGARSEIAEGVIVREGSVISMGVFIGASTKIIDRATGKIFYGEIPPYSVVVPGVLPNGNENQPLLSAAVIVKTVDQKTRSKTSINEILRS